MVTGVRRPPVRGYALAIRRVGKRLDPVSGEPDTGSKWRCCAAQRADWISLTSSPLGLAPAIDCTGSPLTNTVRVGTDITR